MWHLLKVEIQYQLRTVLILLGFLVLVCIYEVAIASERIGYVLLAIYGLTVLSTGRLNKERRINLYTTLPVPARQIGAARIGITGFACLAASSVYLAVHTLVHLQRPGEPVKLVVYSAIMLFCAAVYFIAKDLDRIRSGDLRKTSVRRMPIRAGIITFVLAFNFLTLYAIIQSRLHGKVHSILYYLDKINVLFDAPISQATITGAFLFSLFVAYLSTLTFVRRKSYLE